MNAVSNFRKTSALIYALPVLILLISIYLAVSPSIQLSPALAFGITVDMAVTAPLVYFLIIRKKKIPNITAVTLAIGGIGLAIYVLPPAYEHYARVLKNLMLPVLELGVISFMVSKGICTFKAYRQSGTTELDFITVFRKSAAEGLGSWKAANVLTTEVGMFYFAFFCWQKSETPAATFSYHKQNGLVALLAVVIFIVGVETLVLHILLDKWNTTVAWVVTGLSLYTMVQLFAQLKACIYRPIEWASDQLKLRYGLTAEADIPFDAIENIEKYTRDIEEEDKIFSPGLLKGMEGHNILITLKEEVKIIGLYGLSSKTRKIALHIDEPEQVERLWEETSNS